MGTTWYLGQAGALVALPPPDRDIDAGRARRIGIHELLSGGFAADRVGGRRRHVLKFPGRTADELSILERVAELPGPYVLHDPARRNLLTAQQTSGTAERNDTTGFVVATGTLTSDPLNAGLTLGAGRRSLKWAAPTLGSTGNGPATGNSTSAATLYNDLPVVAGLAYSFGMRAQRSAAGAITMGARVEWYTAAGALISGTTGTGTALGTGAWDLLKVENQIAPATAAYAKVRCVNTATTAAARDVYCDAWQAEEGAVLSVWVMGTGVPIVVVTEAPTALPLSPWYDFELTLQEL